MTTETPVRIKDAWNNFRLLILLPIGILISAGNDLRYSFLGHVAEARLLSARRGDPTDSRSQSIGVKYSFEDPHLGTRTEEDRLPAWWYVPGGPTIEVRYIPGSWGASRVDGHYDGFWLYAICFVGIVAAIVFVIVRLDRQRSQDANDGNRRVLESDSNLK